MEEVQVEVVGDDETFFKMKEVWNHLLLSSAQRRYGLFLSHDWLSCWWTHLGRGRLLVLLVKQGEQLIGLAPFYLTHLFPAPGLRIVRFLGSGVSDYADFILLQGKERAASLAVLDWLAHHQRLWDIVELRELPSNSPTLHTLRHRVVDGQERLFLQPSEPCLQVTLPSSWDEFERSISPRLRKNLRYYERLLERKFKVEFEQVEDAEELAGAMEELFRLHRLRWAERWLPGVFWKNSIRNFHREFAAHALGQGWLALHCLKLDGQWAAMHYCFHWSYPKDGIDSNTLSACFYYGGGFHPQFDKFSVGTVLLRRAIQGAWRQGACVFDFLRGDEDYKCRWGAKPTPNFTAYLLKPNSLRSRVAFSFLNLMDKTRQRTKELARKR